MNLTKARWLKTDGPRGIDRYIDYFGGAMHPCAGHAASLWRLPADSQLIATRSRRSERPRSTERTRA